MAPRMLPPGPRKLAAGLRRWGNASIVNRASIAVGLFGATLVLALLLVAGPILYRLALTSAATDRRNDGAFLADLFVHRIDENIESLTTLAASTEVVGALLDADGRERSLNPLLRSYVPPDHIGRDSLRLVDLNLRHIGGDTPPGAGSTDARDAGAREVIASGRPRTMVSADGTQLRFIVAVVYPPVAGWIGALILDVPLDAVFRPPARWAESHSRCYSLFANGRRLFESPCGATQTIDSDDPVQVPVQLAGPSSQVFELHLGAEPGIVPPAAGSFLLSYLLLALVASVVAWALTRRLFVRLTRPLVELSETAAAIAADPASMRLASVGGDDETGRLAAAFNAMVAELRNLRDKLEQENRDKARQLEAAAEREALTAVGASEGLWDWDVVADQAFISPRLYEMSGYTPDELPPRFSFFERICHPDDFAAAMRELECHLRGDSEELLFDARMITRSGQQRWLMWKGRAVRRDDGGRALRLVGLATDITDRRCAEEAMRASERRYRSLFEHLPMGVFHGRMIDAAEDPERGPGALILDANPAFADLTSLRDAVGRRGDELLPGVRKSNPELFENLGAVAKGAALRRFESYIEALGRWYHVATFSPAAGEFIAAFDDISERKRAELTLRDREQLLRTIGDNLPRAYIHRFVRRRGVGRFEYFSPGFERVHGVSAEAVIADFSLWRGMLDPAQIDAITATVQASERDLTDYSFEARVRNADGSWSWVLIRSRPRRIDADTVVWDGVATDVTDRRQTEEALRRSESLYRSVIDSMVEGVVVQDAAGRILSSNPRARQILGAALEGLLGAGPVDRHWGVLRADGSDFACEEFPVAETLRTGKGQTGVVMGAVREDGVPVWVAVNTGPLLDATGSGLVGVVCSFLDITRRRQIEIELAENQQLFRQAFFGSSIGMALLTPEGSVIRANPALSRITGYAESELVGRRLQRHMPEEDRRRDEHLLAEVAKVDGSGYSAEMHFFAANGKELLLRCTTAAVRDDQGGTMSLIVQVEDITERRRAESADLAVSVLAAQEAERARLSHELHDEVGQSLTALKIALQNGLRHCSGDGLAEVFAPARGIIEHLTADVRRISHRLRPSELDQLGVAAALRAHLDKVGESSGVQIALHENIGDRRLPPTVELCCFRVVQEALTNCLRHACAHRFDVALISDVHGLLLRVADDGSGFDVDRAMRPITEGGSLGLVGMRERVAGAGGRIDIRSRPGAGCEIEVNFGFDIIGR